MKRIAALVSVVALVAATAIAAAPSTLKRIGKVGDTHMYDLKVDISFQGESLVFVAKVIERITEISDDGSYTLAASQKDAKMTMQGQDFPPPEMAETKSKYDAIGNIAEITGDAVDESSYRFASLTAFRRPDKSVAKGDKWEVKIAGNPKIGTLATVCNYEVLDTEKVVGIECFKVKYSVRETEGSAPASSVGTVWINPVDALIVKTEGDMKNAPIAGQVMDAKYTQTLIKS